jgi:glycosyltransferase involved in cell wall biosynthesis
MTSATQLRILMLAPEPFFQPRGTPFSEYHRIKALLDLGHTVDLVTYPIGVAVDLTGLRIVRSPRLPGVRQVAIGPSLLKLVLDLQLAVTSARQAGRESYDVVHSHEEAGIVGLWIARRLGVPHLYDMHSSLPQQLANFRYSRLPALVGRFERLERRMVTRSHAVIVVCKALEERAVALGAGERTFLIENVCGGDMNPVDGPGQEALRARWGVPPGAPVVLYTGTFEPYQGLDLLTDTAAMVAREVPDVRFLVVGGTEVQVEAARGRAHRAGAPMVFTGQRPPHEIPHFIDLCDLLVSPRIAGTNTPLKIYSYLRSGRPIVATDLRTHTQVLDPSFACLAAPEPEAMSAAVVSLLRDPERRRHLAAAASAVAAERYSRDAFLARTAAAYSALFRASNGSGGAPRSTAS